ncbi:MAG: hypothetical protein GY722_03735 [bacterium]|nr:hypothetical protein [bacterium]
MGPESTLHLLARGLAVGIPLRSLARLERGAAGVGEGRGELEAAEMTGDSWY